MSIERDNQDLENDQNIETNDGLIEGQLSKYTNVVKGWQFRSFILNQTRGTFEYYMPDEKKKVQPRGCVYLAGCVISPSEENSQTFTVSAACGEVYKLKASNVKQRQFWVDKLRQVGQIHENQIAKAHPPLSSNEMMSSIKDVRDILIQIQKMQKSLIHAIESFTCTDEHLLLMKATSSSTVMSLEQCFAILRSVQQQKT